MFFIKDKVNGQFLSKLIDKEIYTVIQMTTKTESARTFPSYEDANTVIRKEYLSRFYEVVEE